VVSATLGGSQGSLPVGELPNLTITQRESVYTTKWLCNNYITWKRFFPFTLSTLDGRKFEAFGYGPGGVNDVQMVLSSQKSETITFSTIENGCGMVRLVAKLRQS
jgi:hypothetical protein